MAVINLGDAQGPGAGGDPDGFGQWLAGLPAAAQASIMRVMQNANPVSSANAATADSVSRAPNPLSNPSPVPPQLAGGGPSVPAGAVPPMGTPPIGGGPGMTMQAPTGIVPGGGSSGGGGASAGFTGYDPLTSIQARQPLDPSDPRTRNMPWPQAPQPQGPSIPPGGIHPAVAAAVAGAPVSPAAPAAAQGRNPFTMIDRPNMGPAPMYDQQGNPITPVSGGLARGGPPKMTALDLSGLFGGGRPAAAAAIPASATALAPANKIPATRSVAATNIAPLAYGPLQRGRRWNPNSNDYSP